MTEDEMSRWYHLLNAHEFGELRMLVIDREAWRTAIHGIRLDKVGDKASNRYFLTMTHSGWNEIYVLLLCIVLFQCFAQDEHSFG